MRQTCLFANRTNIFDVFMWISNIFVMSFYYLYSNLGIIYFSTKTYDKIHFIFQLSLHIRGKIYVLQSPNLHNFQKHRGRKCQDHEHTLQELHTFHIWTYHDLRQSLSYRSILSHQSSIGVKSSHTNALHV